MTHIFLYTNILTQTKKNFNSANRKNENPEREIKKIRLKRSGFFPNLTQININVASFRLARSPALPGLTRQSAL